MTIQTATDSGSPYFNYTVGKNLVSSKEYNAYGYYILEETSASPSDYKWNVDVTRIIDGFEFVGEVTESTSGSFNKFGESGKVKFNFNKYSGGNVDSINVSVTHDTGVPDTDVKWIGLTVEEVN